MRLVIIESPYAGDTRRNELYAKACVLDCLHRGESPIASHLLYTQMLDDRVPSERELGIQAGLAWRKVAERAVFYTDFGWSTGMKFAVDTYTSESIPMEVRTLPPKVLLHIERAAAERFFVEAAYGAALESVRKEYGW